MPVMGIAKLSDVRSRDDLMEYYTFNGLQGIEEKIHNLRKEMDIVAIRGESNTSELEEVLSVLEDHALLGYWRASW